LLNRAGFGPRPGDIERVRRIGIERYLDEQLHPENIADDFITTPLATLGTLQQSTPELVQAFAPPPPMPRPTPTPVPTAQKADDAMAKEQAQPKAPTPTPPRPLRNPQQPVLELQQARLLRAAFSERQLQEVMTDFWFNHFNVFAGKDTDRWLVTSYESDVIRPLGFVKFRALLAATAESPAMLYYLDTHLGRAENAQPPRLDPPRPGGGAQPKPGNAPPAQP